MASMSKVRGVAAAIRALKAEKQLIMERARIGLKKAGLHLQRASQKIVPVEFGVLKNSAFTRDESDMPRKIRVIVGYTASYAIYVHEDLNARHKPGKAAKFLESPARDMQSELADIVIREVRKGK